MASIREVITPLAPDSWLTVPSGYAGCIAWGDAARSLAYLRDGDQVPLWPIPFVPLSEAPTTYVLDVTKSPIYRTGANGINGHPTLQFSSAASQLLVLPGNTANTFDGSGITGTFNFYSSAAPGLTAVMVATPVAIPAAGRGPLMWLAGHQGSSRLLIGTPTGALNWLFEGRRLDFPAAAQSTTVPLVLGTPVLLHFAMDFQNAIARIWINGTLRATMNPFLAAGNSDTQGSLALSLGSVYDASESSDSKISYWGLFARYYDKAALASLLPAVAAAYGLVYA